MNGNGVFLKPRTVYWEELLFGSGSPIRRILARDIHFPNLGSISPAHTLFGLKVLKNDLHFGEVHEVTWRPTAPGSSPFDFLQFGMLLGYCFTAGIQDLHYQNVILTDHGPQGIDAEVVFSNLILPNETHLLPLRDSPISSCGMSKLCGTSQLALPTTQAVQVITGFIQMLDTLANLSSEIQKTLLSIHSQMSLIPIRVILRNTKKYRELLGQHQEIPLMHEEVIQLSRGDIPYFFKFLNNPDLYYYTSEKWDFQRVKNLEQTFENTVARAASNPIELFLQNRIRGLLPQGVFYLVRHLMKNSEPISIQSDPFRIELNQKTIRMSAPFGQFQCARFPHSNQENH